VEDQALAGAQKNCPKDFAELTVLARAKLRRTQRRKTLIAAFWKQAELPI
jgi:hypothetical protein